ncbi:MAG: NifU N-terminal domain-containing protein [Nitrospirae bacterium]|nr:NifU N-terminal domain-containing protein [Nitrospirota bacterium]MBI3594804.1 NifU N-terminal domain-containing protein [Nitrospirota bacterium]
MKENPIRFQPTPNPNSMKFVFSKQVVQSGMEIFNSKEEAEKSEIAARLFEIDGLVGVFMMENFVSVNKMPGGNWGVIVPKVMDILKSL